MIAIACFIGSVVGACTTWLLGMSTQLDLALGMIVGAAVGYFAYDFRAVRAMVPVAIARTSEAASNQYQDFLGWLKKPHPFLYATMPLATLGSIALLVWYPWGIFAYVRSSFAAVDLDNPISLAVVPMILVTVCILQFAMMGVAFIIIATIALIGVRTEKCFWYPFFLYSLSQPEETMKEYTRLTQKGLQEKPITYENFFRWLATGLREIAKFFLWQLWAFLAATVLWGGTKLFAQLLWHLVKLIHTQKRSLCAIDSALGVTFSWWFLAGSTTDLAHQILFVAAAGAVGALCGIVHWELVRRMLNVPENGASS